MHFDFSRQILANARNFAEAPAVALEGGRALSHAELASLVQKFTCMLHARGVGRGTRLGIFKLPNLAMLITFLASTRLGATAIAASGLAPEIITKLKPDFMIVGPVPAPAGLKAIKFPESFDDLTEAERSFVPEGHRTPADIAYVATTSGTTGTQKLFELTIEQMGTRLIDQISLLPRPLRRTLLRVQPGALYGLNMSLVTLLQGGKVIWLGSDNDAQLNQLMGGEIDNVISAPMGFASLLELFAKRGLPAPKLDYCVASGSVMSPELATALTQKFCPELYIQYGSTETGPIAFTAAANLIANPGCVGELAPYVKAWTIPETGLGRNGPGKEGKIVFELQAGRKVALAHSPGKRIAVGHASTYFSDDYGVVETNGLVRVLARESERLNMGGNKMTTTRLKENLRDKAGISEPLEVVGITSDHGFDRAVVLIIAEPNRVNEFVERITKSGAVPSEFQVMLVNRFPENAFGKLDAARIREVAREQFRALKPAVV